MGVTRGLLFLRCFFLVLRHTPGTPGTGFTSLLLTGGGCRMGLGARVRHTGSPAAHSSIPVIPGSGGVVMRGRVVTSHALPSWLVDATEVGGQSPQTLTPPTQGTTQSCNQANPMGKAALGPIHQFTKGAGIMSLVGGASLGWVLPASAGCTGPVPFKFFTGSAGTLWG